MINKYKLNLNKLYWFSKLNLIIMLGKYGSVSLYLPNVFFYKQTNISLQFMFNSRTHYITFLKHLAYLVNKTNIVYYLRLKLKGLGYKFKKFCNKLYRFYFTKTNFIYLHLPEQIIIKARKKKFLMLSCNYQKLRTLFICILMLKKIGPYNKRGFIYPRRMVFLKPGKTVS